MIFGIGKGKIPFEFDGAPTFISMCSNCGAPIMFSLEDVQYNVDGSGNLKEMKTVCPVCEKYSTVYTPPIHEIDEKEEYIRQKVYQRGYGLHKSHEPLGENNLGGYAIFDVKSLTYVYGLRFELSLDDVAAWLAK